jgi:acetyltransferase-like isoleucine patch superfamily enzyme
MVFDVGPNGKVTLGDYVMAVAARIICDAHVIMEDYSMIAWDAVLMDTFRVPSDPEARRREIEYASTREPRRIGVASLGRPTRVGRGAWIGSGACVLPGVIVGDGSIVGARAVVTSDVPAYTIVAGNPAKVIRRFSRIERDLFTSILGEMDAAI